MVIAETPLLVHTGFAEHGLDGFTSTDCLDGQSIPTERSRDADMGLSSLEDRITRSSLLEIGLKHPANSHDKVDQQGCYHNPQKLQKSSECLRALVGDVGVALFAPLDIGSECVWEHPVADETRLPPSSLDWGRTADTSDEDCRFEQLLDEECTGSIRNHRSALSPLLKSSEGSLTAATTVTGYSTGFEDDETEVAECHATAQHHDHADEDAWFCWVEPEAAIDLQSCPRILTDSLLQQVTKHLPPSCQGHMLERCFCIGLHGDSLLTMLHQCRSFRYTLLVIQTTKGDVLGGFATEQWNERRHNVYFGNGHSFLFASHPDCLEGVDDHPEGSNALSIYPWSGVNDYCQICDPTQNRIAMGGDGEFGLIVRDNFALGDTGRSRTYRNPPLVAGGRFDIAALEVYGILPFSLSPPSSRPQPLEA